MCPLGCFIPSDKRLSLEDRQKKYLANLVKIKTESGLTALESDVIAFAMISSNFRINIIRVKLKMSFIEKIFFFFNPLSHVERAIKIIDKFFAGKNA